MNLTVIPRYGKTTCFACATEMQNLPGRVVPAPPIAPMAAPIARQTTTITPRATKVPALPSAEEARKVMEECLIGLERAAQDRDMIQMPDLRSVVIAFIEVVQDLLAIDDFIAEGKLTPEWLHGKEPLDSVVRLCYRPLWPAEGTLLPPTVQAWVLAVDDVARRWQYARRLWLAEGCGLTMMPIIPGITPADHAQHEITGRGLIVTQVLTPGFLLGSDVLRKAKVRT